MENIDDFLKMHPGAALHYGPYVLMWNDGEWSVLRYQPHNRGGDLEPVYSSPDIVQALRRMER